VSAGKVVVHIDAIDAGAARPVSHGLFETRQRLGVALRGDFDAAVGKIPDPALNPFARRDVLREHAEADALDATADQIPPGDPHMLLRSRRIHGRLRLERLRLDGIELLSLQQLIR